MAQLAEWCGANNLSLNVGKTKEVVMDFRRNSVDHPPLTIDGSTVERFLNSWGCTLQRISPGPPTSCHSTRRDNSASTFSAGWKGQVSLHPSSPLSTGAPLRVRWPPASLSGMGTAVLLTARPYNGQWTLPKKIIGAPLPSILHIFLARCSSKASSIVKDPTHPSHNLFQLLPSGRRYRSIKARSVRLLNSFSPRLWELLTPISLSPSETMNTSAPSPHNSLKLLTIFSCFLCPLVLSVTVWLSKRVYKIKLIN